MTDRLPLLALSAAALLGGCVDGPAPPAAEPDPPPRITIEGDEADGPPQLDFGVVRVRDAATRELTITNHGEDFAALFEVDKWGADRVLIDAEFPLLVDEGGSETLQLRYLPYNDETVRGGLTFRTNDVDDPEIDVVLRAEGVAPRVVFEPEDFDFGDVEIGCTDTVEVTIRNDGRGDLPLADVVVSEMGDFGSFDVVGAPLAGDVLDPGAEVRVRVSMTPRVEFRTSLSIRLEEDGSRGYRPETHLSGRGVERVGDCD